jgi:hypothetical protein
MGINPGRVKKNFLVSLNVVEFNNFPGLFKLRTVTVYSMGDHPVVGISIVQAFNWLPSPFVIWTAPDAIE